MIDTVNYKKRDFQPIKVCFKIQEPCEKIILLNDSVQAANSFIQKVIKSILYSMIRNTISYQLSQECLFVKAF